MSHAVPPVPTALESRRALGSGWADWLDRLPRLQRDLLDEWELAVDGEPMHGWCSLVLPVLAPTGEPAVLKLGYDGDDESEHESLVLQRWGGDGAVRLLRADPRRRALLLERLDTQDLGDSWDVEACEVVAGLYPRLHVPAPPQLRTVSSYVGRWADDLHALGHDHPLPRRLVEQALSLAGDLVGDPGSGARVVHGDLHYANVLAGGREQWLAIDPKPMAGDPHYEPAPMLWNRWEELGGPGRGVRDGVRQRFHTLVDAGGLDEDRARDWVVVRAVLNAGWTVQDARRLDRVLDPGERAWVTRCITVAKAVQD